MTIVSERSSYCGQSGRVCRVFWQSEPWVLVRLRSGVLRPLPWDWTNLPKPEIQSPSGRPAALLSPSALLDLVRFLRSREECQGGSYAVSTQFVFVVNHPVTSIWESISRVKSAAVCSEVLDLLRTQSPLVALPASLEQRSADSAETVLATREGVSARSSTSRQSTSQESAFVVSPSSDAAKLSNAASRQQFLRSPRTSLRACSGLFTRAGVGQARIELPIDLRNQAGGSADFQPTRAAITAECANP